MPMTPLQAAADAIRAANQNVYSSDHPDPPRRPGQRPTEPPAFSPPISVEDLSTPELRYQWEKARCYALAVIFRQWFLAYVAWARVPLDDVLELVETAALLVEATMLARNRWPQLAPPEDAGDDDGPGGITTADAAEMGLTIAAMPARKARKPKGTLPGCGTVGCVLLRRPGDAYCPTCARKMIEKWRSE
jgi:hypothetical protein